MKAVFIVIMFSVSQFLTANFVRNQPMEQVQPDGTVLHLFVSGDEYNHRVHDADGFTVVRNPLTGFAVYAVPDGNSIKASDYVVGKISPSAIGIQPNLMKEESEEEKSFRTQQVKSRTETRTSPTGSYNNLVCFVKFSDQTEFPTTMNYSSYGDLFNSRSQQSLKDYYAEVSASQLMIESVLYPAADGSGYVTSLTTAFERGYYSPYDAVNNPGGYSDEDEKTDRQLGLFVFLIANLDALVPDQVDVDSDNDLFVDQITFVFRGPTDAWGDILWPALTTWEMIIGTINGYWVNKYVKLFENSIDIGVICHETGHNIGFPDLYHYNNDGLNPVSSWDVMASANAQHELTYMKWKYGHWFSTVPIITPTSVSVEYTLAAIDQNPYSCFKIASFAPFEYYMLEYRRKAGRYESGLPGNGLIVYRIIERYFTIALDGNADGPPDEVYVYRPGGDLTNDGVVGWAPFSATAGRIEFNNETDPTPWLHLYPNLQLEGDLILTDIGVSGNNTITFRVRNSVLPEYIWDGSVSDSWNLPANWSRNEVPTYDSNVLIPYGVPNYPRTSGMTAINDLHVEPGASIYFGSNTFQVRGNFENEGAIYMYYSDADLVVEGNMYFRNGSSMSGMSTTARMYFHGNLNFDAGSNVQLTTGSVEFNDTGNSFISVNAPTQIGNFTANVPLPDYLYVISDNGSKLTINGHWYVRDGTGMAITSDMTVAVTGEFWNMDGTFFCTAGTVRFEGSVSTSIDNSVVSTNYFHDLTIAKSGSATVTLSTAIEVMGRLRIEHGASLLNAGKTMIIHEDLLSYGFLNLTGTDDIYVYNDIIWGVGCTASVASNDIIIQVAGDMTFLPGSNIDLDYGLFFFYANGISTIGVYEDASICVIGCFKSDPYYLAIDGESSKSLFIGMGIQVNAGNILKVVGPTNIHMTGFLTINGLLQCDDGTFIFEGNTDSDLTCSSTNGNYFHYLKIIKQNSHKVNLLANLKIGRDLLISAGVLKTNNYTIEIQGNWTNNVGEPGFLYGTGQVIFSGTHNQYCYGEHFSTLVLNKPSGELIFTNNFSRCMFYDWTAGAIRVDNSTFMADDLVDSGVYGTFTLNSGAVELHQDTSSLVDLNAFLTIHGGTFSIVGGSAAGRWANGANAGITMDGGVLEFIDNGILYRSSSYTMSLNFSGGVIRTNSNLSITKSNTVISSGTFEMFGSTDAIVTFGSGTGISIPNLIINKGAKSSASATAVSRNSDNDVLRTNLATASTNLTLNGSLTILSGTFNVNGKTITVAGNVSVNGTLQMTATGGSGAINAGGDFTWNNGSTANVTGGSLQYAGNWRFYTGCTAVLTACPVTFNGTVNKQITSSSSTANFGNLTFNGTPGAGTHVDVSLSPESTQPLVVSGLLAINTGNYFYLGGKTVTVSDNVTLTGTSLLYIDANAILQMASAKSLTVNTGGTLAVRGCNGHLAKLTHQTGYYNVNIESGGTISASYGLFEYMGTSGVNVKTGSLVDSTFPFNYCTFQNGASSGSLLTVNSSQTITVYGAIFPTNTWSGSYNVSKTATQGTVTFINATGGFSGESYDGDLLFRIFWTSDTYELVILSSGPLSSSPYVCDPMTYNVTIYNSSISNINVPVKVDIYYNRSDAPPVGLAGDQSLVVSSLAAQTWTNLTYEAASSNTEGIWHTWFQVDPLNEIVESNEANNVNGFITTTWNALPAVPTPEITYDPELEMLVLNWTYPISVNQFNIYSSNDPVGPFTTLEGTVTSGMYRCTLDGEKKFYRITAVRNWP